jgi:putative PIG3 family NAD(P)H quinone oxidoreductase
VRALTIVDGDLIVDERPMPVASDGEVVVRVHGAGLNRADLYQRAGHYPAPSGVPADIPGLEFAGIVEQAGAGASRLQPGDRVFGLVGGGAHAEYVRAHASHCVRVPDGLDLMEMGGVPEAFITSHDALVTQAHAAPNEWVLVHAVASGVGTAALQLAKAFGNRVVGTARTPAKLERCGALGLDAGMVTPTNRDGALDVDALAWSIIEATGGGADITLDLAGGGYVAVDVNAAAPKGRIVLIGTMAGGRSDLPVAAVVGKRLTIIGTMLRPRTIEEKAEATHAFARDVVPLLADGQVRPVVEAVLPLERAKDAYALLASDATFGKVVLDCRALAEA